MPGALGGVKILDLSNWIVLSIDSRMHYETT